MVLLLVHHYLASISSLPHYTTDSLQPPQQSAKYPLPLQSPTYYHRLFGSNGESRQERSGLVFLQELGLGYWLVLYIIPMFVKSEFSIHFSFLLLCIFLHQLYSVINQLLPFSNSNSLSYLDQLDFSIQYSEETYQQVSQDFAKLNSSQFHSNLLLFDSF